MSETYEKNMKFYKAKRNGIDFDPRTLAEIFPKRSEAARFLGLKNPGTLCSWRTRAWRQFMRQQHERAEEQQAHILMYRLCQALCVEIANHHTNQAIQDRVESISSSSLKEEQP